MTIFPLAPDQTIAQMWSNGARNSTTPGTAMSVAPRASLFLPSLRFCRNRKAVETSNLQGEPAKMRPTYIFAGSIRMRR